MLCPRIPGRGGMLYVLEQHVEEGSFTYHHVTTVHVSMQHWVVSFTICTQDMAVT